MALSKRYLPAEVEPRLLSRWRDLGIYNFSPQADGPVFSIDTPPATVSGRLHLGHTYSYSHPDFIARFWRMRGFKVFYPMGFDDNGLPTERLVERLLETTALELGRSAFIQKCLETSEQAEAEYRALWQRLGLSIDWRYTYRTIDTRSRRTSQLSFIKLYKDGLAYQREAPAIWCPECQTAIAQAEINDLARDSEFISLAFGREDGGQVAIATTRPELLPACVAVFVHPDDPRHQDLVGERLRVPIFGQTVPVIADPLADPEKGTGVVMCCTFGDTTDVTWWYTHRLPFIEALDRSGRMTEAAGDFAGLPAAFARREIKQALTEGGLVMDRRSTAQSVRVHERCDTPVEYVISRQWFIRVLDFKDELLKAGENIRWFPGHMQARYRAWVENLNWDWCISRQRYFGVPFPVWYCQSCGEVILADEHQLPVDPSEQSPEQPCACGSERFIAEQDIMDTWATSSMTPQIVGQWLNGDDDRVEGLYERVFPYTLRPQAHEIIRTWAFYTILKSQYHFDSLPWNDVLISGWGIAGEGMGKISKSRGGGPMPPMDMIERYSADAVRYWAASTGPGKDSVISEEKIQLGGRLVNKLWNVARFCARFLQPYVSPDQPPETFTSADRWILASVQRLTQRMTDLMLHYEYAAAKSEVENFFWRDLADNYLEMCKQRLYDQDHPQRAGAIFSLYHVLLTTLKLFAPFLPFVTEEIYLNVFAQSNTERRSIHLSAWPHVDNRYDDDEALNVGEILIAVATAVRRYKSERNLPLGSELKRLQLVLMTEGQVQQIEAAIPDLLSITRASHVEFARQISPGLEKLVTDGQFEAAIER